MQEIIKFLENLDILKIILYGGVIIVLAIGLYGIMKKKNIVKIIMCIGIIETAINIFLISIVYQPDRTAPIVNNEVNAAMVDPLPHALVLTAIVIGVAVLALGLSFAIKYFELTGKTNISKMRDLNK